MIPDSLDFILRPTNDEQAEYAAAHKSEHACERVCEYAMDVDMPQYSGITNGITCGNCDHYKTPAPADAGEAEAGAGQTPASPTVPLGEAGPHSSDADAVGAPASEGPRDLVYVGGRVGEAPLYWGCDVTVYVGDQRGTLRGHDWITPERLRGAFVRLCHPETGRMDGGDMLYIEVGAEPFGDTGRLREIISSRVVDRDQFDRMTGITDLRRDLGWRD